MGSGVTKQIGQLPTDVKHKMEKIIEDDENETGYNNINDLTVNEPITKRRCKNFKVHHTGQGKKFLHIQRWLGEIDLSDEFNPLMPLPGFDIPVSFPKTQNSDFVDQDALREMEEDENIDQEYPEP